MQVVTEVTLNEKAPPGTSILAGDIKPGQWFFADKVSESRLLFRAYDSCPDRRDTVRLIDPLHPNKTYSWPVTEVVEGYRPVSRVHITTEE